MIKKDIEKLQKLKKSFDLEIKNKNKIKKKIEKIESKYICITCGEEEVVEAFYLDIDGNKVALMKDGNIYQFEGTSLSKNFLSFTFAFFILLLLYLLLIIISAFKQEWKPVLDSAGIVINCLSIILNVLNCYYSWDIMKKYKSMFIMLFLATILNLFSLAHHIIGLDTIREFFVNIFN